MTVTVIPLFDNFTALDAVGPYEVLSRLPEADLVFTGPSAGTYRTDRGSLGVVVERTFADLAGTHSAIDVLLVPGGPGTRAVLNDEAYLEAIRQLASRATWVTSVCTGSLVLAAAGLLDGVEATTHWGARELLATLGAVVVEERVVVRGRVATAAGVSAGIDLGLTLAAEIAGEDIARAIQLGIEYDPQPPFDSGNAATADQRIVDLVRGLSPPKR